MVATLAGYNEIAGTIRDDGRRQVQQQLFYRSQLIGETAGLTSASLRGSSNRFCGTAGLTVGVAFPLEPSAAQSKADMSETPGSGGLPEA